MSAATIYAEVEDLRATMRKHATLDSETDDRLVDIMDGLWAMMSAEDREASNNRRANDDAQIQPSPGLRSLIPSEPSESLKALMRGDYAEAHRLATQGMSPEAIAYIDEVL